MKETFGEIVKRLRGNRTKKEIAQLAGFSAEYIRRIEEENKIPSLQILRKLAKGLGVNEKTLIFESLKKRAPTKEVEQYFSPFYRELRKELLDAYSSSFFTSSTPATLIEIKEELETSQFHPFEHVLLYMTMRYLEQTGNFPKEKKKDYFFNIADEAEKKWIKKAKLHWVYDKRLQLLTYAFGDTVDRFYHINISPRQTFLHPPQEINPKAKETDARK